MEDRPSRPGSARSLSQIFGLDPDDRELWDRDELAGILRHQLAAPLEYDLSLLADIEQPGAESFRPAEGPPIVSYADLFHHPSPPAELLQATKQFARSCLGRADSPLPDEIATLLHTLSIVVAMVKCGRRITSADDAALRRSIDWAADQPWVDDATRGLLRQGYAALETTAPAPADQDTVVLRRLGEYRLLEKLGEGGMGTVYKARHVELDRVVALKILPAARVQDEHAVARFRREMKAVGRLDHPNLVRAHDARQIDGVHFLVMEYVEGLDLAELVSRIGPLPVADACELIRQAAVGLDQAHRHGLVHRDIKPSNLMLDTAGRVKILDLGLARIQADRPAGDETTAAGQVMGTPDYMAPEQISDSHVADIRSDLYSLGCTLFRLLTGRAPFSGPQYQSAFQKMTGHVREPAPPLGLFRDDLPAGLVALLDRMMAKSPDDRPATPGEVAESLAPWTAGCDLPALLARAMQLTSHEENEAVAQGLPSPASGSVAAQGLPSPASGSVAAQGLPSPASGRGAGGEGVSPQVTARVRPARQRVARVMAILLLVVVVLWIVAHRRRNHLLAPPGDNGVPATTVPTDRPAPAAAAAAASPQSPGWIVLSWTRPRLGRPNLWLVSPNGKQRYRVTNEPDSFDVHPSFSPDGRHIAFIRGVSLGGSTGVWVCRSDGSELRQLVSAEQDQRFFSPVWVSDRRIYYVRDPRADLSPDMEVWQADLDGSPPSRMFDLQTALGEGNGMATDVSPDRRQLVLLGEQPTLSATADVYVSDLQGRQARVVWADPDDNRKDARAIWSPDGTCLAWQHGFTAEGDSATAEDGGPTSGVGLACLDGDRQWQVRLQPAENQFVIPLAWSPDGEGLLCAEIHDPGQLLPSATLFLMDRQFHQIRVLFDLETTVWQPGQRDFGRLADWAVVPQDVPIRP